MIYHIHTQWSWWFKQSDWFAISDYDVIFTALGGEYKAKQNRCRELGVLPSFRVRTFLKYKNIPVLMILKVRKDSMVFKQRDFIAKWFTVVDFHTLEAIMFLLTTTEEKEDALTPFYELGISSQDQFCLEIEDNLWGKKEIKSFRKLYVPATRVFFAWACATAEQAVCMEAHHRVCLHQNGAS